MGAVVSSLTNRLHTIHTVNTFQEMEHDMTVFAPNELLTDDQRHAERLAGLAGLYQGTDRILTGERLNVVVEDYPGAPAAWTDGNRIHINRAEIDSVDFDTVERMHGLNFHELAHVLYTPRRNTSLTSWAVDNDFMRSFNMLEDQRIETLLSTRYPSTIPWLTAAIARWVVGEPEAIQTGYLLVRGRRYLPGVFRGAFRATFIRQDLLADVDRIIDRFRSLVFPNDYELAQELVEEFDAIIKEVQASTPDTPTGKGNSVSCPFGHGQRPTETLGTGRPKGPAEQRSTQQRASDGEDEVPPSSTEDDNDDDVDSDNDSSSNSESTDKSDDEGSDGDSSDNGRDEDNNPSQTGTGSGSEGPESEATSQSPASDGGRQAGSGAGTELLDIAQRVLEEFRADSEVHEDIKRSLRQVAGNGGSDTLSKAKWDIITPEESYRSMYGSFRKILDRLRQQAEPGWITRETSGKINAARWNRERDISTAFDAWDEGVHDSTDLEVVILLDESGSMGGLIGSATNAMWVTKRALDYVGASTTVITFDDTSRTLYHRNDRAESDNVRFSFRGGGTDPVDGLAQAARIFARSKSGQKVLIVFTDGDWSVRTDKDDVTSDEYIQKMNRSGVLTTLGFLTDPEFSRDGENVFYANHGAQVHANVTGDALVPFMQSLVTNVIKRRLVRR